MSAMRKPACWVAVLAVALAACNPSTDVEIGSLRVSVVTDGTNPDPDGYTVRLEEQSGQAITINGDVTISELEPGEYAVRLTELAPNCFVVGSNPVTVPVTAGQQTLAAFNVSCPAANPYVRVTTLTSGTDLDPDGYLLKIGTAEPRRVTSQGVINLTVPQEGTLPIELTDVAPHCTPDPGNPATVTVVMGQVNPITLRLACANITGTLRIEVVASGDDPQQTDFRVSVDGVPIPLNTANEVTIRRPAGTHSVALDENALQGNCQVSGENPRSVTVTVGGTTTETIAVACTALPRLLVTVSTTGQDIDSDGYQLRLSYISGTYYGSRQYEFALPAQGSVTSPAMLPETYQVSLSGIASNCRGTMVPTSVTVPSVDVQMTITIACDPARQLAFVTGEGSTTEIAIGSEASATFTRLTTNAVADSNPAWSPDGSRLAFTSARDGNSEIYVMNADGGGVLRLTTTAAADYQPNWSSDGSRIAFVSERDGNAEIYVMNADGSSPMRLTTSFSADVEPAWSPAGNRILFVGGRRAVHVMNADGSGITQLTSSIETEASPTWSPSGAQIAYMRSSFGVYQLHTMNASGGLDVTRNGYVYWSTSASWGLDDRIAFTGLRCDDYYCYGAGHGVSILQPDGSVADLPWPVTSEPAWRP